MTQIKARLISKKRYNRNMDITLKKVILSCLFLLIYSLLFYCFITLQLRLDFASFYIAATTYMQGVNPYINHIAPYLATPTLFPVNLNPPFFIQLISPLACLNFQLAGSIWYLCSLILGLIGVFLLFKIICSKEYFKKRWLILNFVYLGMFATMMNASIGQMGSILLFFIITGYYFYLRQQDSLAGLFWGIIIAIKIFPGLLFFFVLNQKRYKAFVVMLIICFLALSLSLFTMGAEIYGLYFKMLPRVLWFGDNWNASLYGFLFRLFIEKNAYQNLWLVKIAYLLLFIILLFWYLKKISVFRKKTKNHNNPEDHREFCLTLVMMLLMSPLGWLYYFPLLLMPLMIIWQSLTRKKTSLMVSALWTFGILLINFPLGYVEVVDMGSITYKLSLYSIYFYGLVIITFLLSRLNEPSKLITLNDEKKSGDYLYPVKIALIIGVSVILIVLLSNFKIL